MSMVRILSLIAEEVAAATGRMGSIVHRRVTPGCWAATIDVADCCHRIRPPPRGGRIPRFRRNHRFRAVAAACV